MALNLNCNKEELMLSFYEIVSCEENYFKRPCIMTIGGGGRAKDAFLKFSCTN